MNNYTLPIMYEGIKSYDIIINNSFNSLAQIINELNFNNRRIMIVSDSNVSKLYLETIINILSDVSDSVFSFVFPAGEKSKNLATINDIYEQLITNKFDRNDLLVALGGGVVGDMTGFCAATYLRGIEFIQLPTTILSQVDSSIGGKTGVDFKAYKNMVGAFKMPKLVYINTSVLNSLSKRDFASGMGEVVKHGIIRNADFFKWLSENKEAIVNLNPEIIQQMILANCKIKKAVVEEDPEEKGLRAILNFGHTIGHAVEKLKDFSLFHGECVAIGINAASYISYKRGLISMDEFESIKRLLQQFDLPITTEGISATAIADCTLNDKKMDSGKIKFTLINSIGDAFIDSTVRREEIIEASDYILCN